MLLVVPAYETVNPDQRHSGEEREILNKRKAVYEMAKAQNPKRWSDNTRNWEPVGEVWLNPETQEVKIKEEAA